MVASVSQELFALNDDKFLRRKLRDKDKAIQSLMKKEAFAMTSLGKKDRIIAKLRRKIAILEKGDSKDFHKDYSNLGNEEYADTDDEEIQDAIQRSLVSSL